MRCVGVVIGLLLVTKYEFNINLHVTYNLHIPSNRQQIEMTSIDHIAIKMCSFVKLIAHSFLNSIKL